MADTTPSPISPWRALYLCALLIVAPEKFNAAEARDDEWRANNPSNAVKRTKGEIVRAAFFSSFIEVVLAAAFGYATGFLTKLGGLCFTGAAVAWIQIAGASILLWGTLFIRGYEISSWSGVTYSERVNQWIYRALYCVGTSIAVFSLAVQQCKA